MAKDEYKAVVADTGSHIVCLRSYEFIKGPPLIPKLFDPVNEDKAEPTEPLGVHGVPFVYPVGQKPVRLIE
jgi:hypothetical protein